MKEPKLLEKIEKVLYKNQHILHYVDEYKNVAKKIFKLYISLESVYKVIEEERDELKDKYKRLMVDYNQALRDEIIDKHKIELQTLKEEVRKYIYEKEDNYPKLKELIK